MAHLIFFLFNPSDCYTQENVTSQTRRNKMDNLTIKQAAERSKKIREHYRSLEMKHHGSEWSVEEDALAFLTDAGLWGA